MIPSLVNRLSSSLRLSRSPTRDGQSSSNDTADSALSTKSTSGSSIGTLRRQSTRKLSSEDEGSLMRKVTSRTSITSVRTSSIIREVSKTRSMSLTSHSSRQMLKRVSKAPSRLVEEEDRPALGKESSLVRSASKTSSKQLSRTPSRQPSLSRSGSKGSLSRSSSKGSMTKKTSVKAAPPVPVKKVRPGGKELWFEAGAYLTVRNEEGGFFLCRAVNNIYNTSKVAKIRWLGPKTGRRKRRGFRLPAPVNPDAYELMYRDEVDPTAILMEVAVERKGTTFTLNDEDKEETERLMQVAEDVEQGKLDKSNIGDDVEEAIQVDYEPPAKRRKLQAGASPSPKRSKSPAKASKPRLKKTASQKEREKARKAEEKREKKAKKEEEREEKKRKKKEAAEERKRKSAKKVDEDTTLYPNPKVKVIEKDPLWDTTTHMPYVSKYSNSKLAFRAVKLKDTKLLRKLLKDAERIHSLDHRRSVMWQETPLEYALRLGNKEATDLLVEDSFGSKFQDRHRDSHGDRLLISKLGTGRYNFRSLGIGRIRPIMASRGAREGNNALVKDEDDLERFYDTDTRDFLLAAMLKGADKDMLFKAMNEMEPPDPKDTCPSFSYGNMNTFISNLPMMLARGYNQTAGEILKVIQNSRYHARIPGPTWKVLVAKDVAELPSIPPSSINLNVKSIKGFTMIHIAASNPNPEVLEKVLNSDPNFLVSDAKGIRPVHIAAGCSAPDTLQLLLTKGANPYDADSDGETALHYAIRAGRTKNVEILLKLITDPKSHFVDPTAGKATGGLNRANKKSMGPLHMACEQGHTEIAKLLVKHGANVDSKTSINALSVTPLMYAAGAGHLDIVRCLVDGGAVAEFRDRVGRTALMHAAMNGSTSVMSYLLNIGASPNRKDTSGNTALHYAAGYGWYFSVKLLLDAGANPAVSNDWKTTPLSVAYLKSHQGIVSLLLEDDRVDVNFPNEEGETLLFIACASEKEEDLLEQISYLVQEKGADCTVINNAGETLLHTLAVAFVHKEDSYVNKDEETIYTKWILDESASKVVFEIAKLLVEKGCDVTKRDKSGYTPAMIALKMGNLKLAQYLVEKGGFIYSDLSQKADQPPDSMLHHRASSLLDGRYGDPNAFISFLTKTFTVNGLKKSFSSLLDVMAVMRNRNGETALHVACRSYAAGRFQSYEAVIQRETFLWENAFTFLKTLVAKGDVNAAIQPEWKEFGTPEADKAKVSDYAIRSQAKWTPLFFMVEANDPYFNSHKKYDSGVQGRGLKYLLNHGADVNVHDLQGASPLARAVQLRKGPAVLEVLIDDGRGDVDGCLLTTTTKVEGTETKEITLKIPLICYAAEMLLYDEIDMLLKYGVKVNAVDERTGDNVLHILAKKRSHSGTLRLMQKMLEAGLGPNARNKDNRTALHLLVNSNAGRIDDSFEEEILLLSKKADLTVRDEAGRIPLHYVFVKHDQTDSHHDWDNASRSSRSSSSSSERSYFHGNSGPYNRSQFDPVDLCKLLVKAMKAADLNIRDKSGSTPLHYAAQRGASICCMYLMQKGADPDIKDKNGNTALSLAVQAKQDSCGSILIQQGADLLSPVVLLTNNRTQETQKDLPPEWTWKPLTSEKKTETKKEVPLFQEAIKNGLVGVSFLILEWPVEKSGITLVDAIEMAVKNSQFNVALRLLSTTIKGSAEVCATRDEKRNMLHILALHADPNNNQHQQEKLAKTLIDKGVQANTKDRHGCTPLLYATYNKNWKLAQYFADLPGGLDVKYVDNFGRNLVASSLWRCFFTGLPHNLWDWIEQLAKKKIDLNRKFDYPLLTDVFGSKSVRSGDLQDPDYWRSYPQSQTTPLIFALHCKDFIFTHNLLQWGANPNLADQQALTPLMHAVKLNSVKHVKQLMKYNYDPDVDDKEPEKKSTKKAPQKKRRPVKKNVFILKKIVSDVTNTDSEPSESEEEEEVVKNPTQKKEKVFFPVKKTSSVNLDATDRRGWTALHYVACPLEDGTYDNDELVFVLGKAGAKLNVRSFDGETPLDLALANSAPKVAAMLQTLMGVDKKNQKQPADVPADHRVDDKVARRLDYDFHSDADRQLAEGEEDMEEDEAFEPGVSSYCNATNGTIARDEEQDLPYEVLMTKCDAHLGVWGLYNFYQIQLVHQPGQNLYVLFTRWGRIGDSGQYQHTPFGKKEDAVKEFCKIFREKSGNKWEDVKSFEQKPKKYRLVPVEERRPPKKQKAVEFDFKTAVKTTLPDDIQRAMNIMMNIEALQNSYHRDINVDTNVLPFGRFSRERLLKAKQLLEEMGALVNNIGEFRKDSRNKTKEEKDAHQEDCQKVSRLSSDFYQLIPQKNFVYEQLRPLDQIHDFQRQFKLITNLLDFEVSTKMMLGAMYRKAAVHPLDYVYNMMKCKLQLMDRDDPMTQYILRYGHAGGQGRQRFEAVYKVEREGEEMRFQACGLDNRRLLWHGTRTANLVSILNRGLVATPLDASLTGNRFGMGIYFADLFTKSDAYTDSSRNSSNFMLLCEVALGKQRNVHDDVDGVPDGTGGYNSSLAMGYYLPDADYDVRLPSGKVMPLGDSVTEYYYETTSGDRRHKSTQYNEYIVYDESQVCIRYLVQYRNK